jgi:hypothetical protein
VSTVVAAPAPVPAGEPGNPPETPAAFAEKTIAELLTTVAGLFADTVPAETPWQSPPAEPGTPPRPVAEFSVDVHTSRGWLTVYTGRRTVTAATEAALHTLLEQLLGPATAGGDPTERGLSVRVSAVTSRRARDTQLRAVVAADQVGLDVTAPPAAGTWQPAGTDRPLPPVTLQLSGR